MQSQGQDETKDQEEEVEPITDQEVRLEEEAMEDPPQEEEINLVAVEEVMVEVDLEVAVVEVDLEDNF